MKTRMQYPRHQRDEALRLRREEEILDGILRVSDLRRYEEEREQEMTRQYWEEVAAIERAGGQMY